MTTTIEVACKTNGIKYEIAHGRPLMEADRAGTIIRMFAAMGMDVENMRLKGKADWWDVYDQDGRLAYKVYAEKGGIGYASNYRD